jgi:uncharacterized protein YndB with AHSA1/START domain
MMDIVHQLIARTTPEKVYHVLTDPTQIAAWYAQDVQVKPDSILEFHFNRGVIRVQVTELEPNHKVAWKVLQGLSGWEGVTGNVTWLLTTPFDSGTMVTFTHSGWLSMDGPYPSTNFKWAWFFTRMKSYLETGVASPAM